MLYEPLRDNRLFAVGMKYSEIDENSLTSVLDAFEKRIDQWYIEPIRVLRAQKGQHGAFASLAMCCVLIDCLCQFENGKVVSNRSLFTNFVKRRLPHYNRTLTPPIIFPKINSHTNDYERNASGRIRTRNISNVADVIYYIYRCGILHSAHAPLCGVISGLPTRRFSIRRNSLTKYGSIGTAGDPCPTVLIDPWKLFDDLESVFQNYLQRIRIVKNTSVFRQRFNVKFADAFGIDVSNAT